MSRKKAYIYPITARLKTGVSNPYLDDFMDALQNDFDFLNRPHPSNKGILNIFKFIFKTDFIFLKWIEDLPDKFLGKIQTFIFIFILKFSKARRIKIVWTLHNRDTHYKNNIKFKKLIIRKLAKYADIIITHAKDGIAYANELGIDSKKVFFHNHPVKNMWVEKNAVSEFDILIWGTITPYKGVHHFLEKIKENSQLKICIAGKILNPEYKQKILKHQNQSIKIIDSFLEFDELKKLVANSKYILFTYQDESVLSSGALMDSIGFGANVIGPNIGAFKDLAEEGILMTYNNFNEIPEIVQNPKEISKDKMLGFIEGNGWEEFSWRFVSCPVLK
jgi:beta-1,4-mannosyltransferase